MVSYANAPDVLRGFLGLSHLRAPLSWGITEMTMMDCSSCLLTDQYWPSPPLRFHASSEQVYARPYFGFNGAVALESHSNINHTHPLRKSVSPFALTESVLRYAVIFNPHGLVLTSVFALLLLEGGSLLVIAELAAATYSGEVRANTHINMCNGNVCTIAFRIFVCAFDVNLTPERFFCRQQPRDG